MTLLIRISKFIMNVIYFFFKCQKTRNQITMISRQSNYVTDDFRLLENELKNDYEIVILCKELDNKFLYLFHMLKQMYHISRSKIVILDSYSIAISNLKHKKSLKIIQIWHALGLIKKAGYAIIDKEEGRSKKMSALFSMHKNYNYVFTTSKNCIDAMSQVFGCDKNIVYSVPLPRIDLLKNKKVIKQIQSNIYKEYPILKQKQNVIYIPTYRKDETLMGEKVKELIDKFDYENFNLIVKLHPLSKIKIDNERVITAQNYSSLEMLYIADYSIGDYSSLTYEAGILNVKQIFYAFDLDNYKGKRDFFINYEKEMPGPIIKDAKEIIGYIEKNKNKKGTENYKFVSKYVDLKIKNYTINMCNYIKKIDKGLKI